jgi:two-component system, sensor histidine kinase
MEQPMAFFNWSLKKVLLTESDAFVKAKINIVFVILIFSLVKLSCVIPVLLQNNQHLHLPRAITMLVLYLILLKLLLANKNNLKMVAHALACIGLFVIWSNVLMYAKAVNLITVQFVFMMILSAFYILGRGFGIFYSALTTIPVISFLVFPDKLVTWNGLPNELASPGYEIILVLNFISIIYAHYLFQQAFVKTLAEKENLNKQLHLAVNEANNAALSKSDFLSSMSHELRTPLNSVIGISELLLMDSTNQEQEENLKILKFSAVNLHSLINDILDFNKLDSERVELEAISVNLNELMNDICAGLQFQAKQKGIKLIVTIDELLESQDIISDPTRITQIIYNLAGNAIKFTEKGSVSVTLQVLCLDEEEITVQFSVIDTGIGISADKQEAIFEPFTQASSSTTRNFGGTGLGLAIVKRLLSLFESKINLQSVAGSGSTFFFDIVFKLNKEPSGITLENPESEYDLSGLKILVAEDNQMNRVLLLKVFSKWNNEPVFALNGREAIEMLSKDSYDVVLMDLHMPLMDGYEAARSIRGIADPVKAAVPIIALTASVSDNLNSKVREAGMDDYILKPFKLKDLYNKLKDIPVKMVACKSVS